MITIMSVLTLYQTYAVIEITEHLIIDLEIKERLLLVLVSGFYEVTVFMEKQEIKSLLLPVLGLTAKQIFELIDIG